MENMSITPPGSCIKRPIPIVLGVVRRRQAGRWRVLISQRPHNAVLGGFWEFPGGKIQPGETPQQAVQRELAEELGIQVAVEQPILSVEHDYDHGRVQLQAFYCRVVAGQPQALEVAAWRWVDADDLPRYDFPPANGPLIAAVVRDLAAPG